MTEPKFELGDRVKLKPGDHITFYDEYEEEEEFVIKDRWETGHTGGGWCYTKNHNIEAIYQDDLILAKINSWRDKIGK